MLRILKIFESIYLIGFPNLVVWHSRKVLKLSNEKHFQKKISNKSKRIFDLPTKKKKKKEKNCPDVTKLTCLGTGSCGYLLHGVGATEVDFQSLFEAGAFASQFLTLSICIV